MLKSDQVSRPKLPSSAHHSARKIKPKVVNLGLRMVAGKVFDKSTVTASKVVEGEGALKVAKFQKLSEAQSLGWCTAPIDA